MQNYKLKIKHKAGENTHVDACKVQYNRQIAYVNSLSLERELEIRQAQNAKILEIANDLEFSDNKNFELIDELVYRKSNDRSRDLSFRIQW